MIGRVLRENFEQLGPLNGMLYLLDRIFCVVSRDRARLYRYLLVAQPVSAQNNGLRTSAASPVQEITRDDPMIADFPRPPEVIAQRFDTGARCFAAEVRDRFAGYLWLSFDGYDEYEVRCRYEFASPDVSAWDFDVYVVPEFRMGRTFVRLWNMANREMATRGVHWSFSRISVFNPGSMAAHRRMGMNALFTATFLCLGPLQFALIGAAPYIHIGWSAQSRPVVRLQVPE